MDEDVRIDIFLELYSRNLDHIIDQICANNLTHRDIVNIHQVSRIWNDMFHKNEGITTGSIWRRVLHFKCKHDTAYKYLSALNRWWPDSIRSYTVGDKEEDEEIEKYVNPGLLHDGGAAKSYEKHERIRRRAVFESVDVALDIRININIEKVKKAQTRLLFVGGIVSILSFCGDGGRYLFCGMLNGDIKLWELWKYDTNGKRKLEVLGRAWKVFKGHQERINGLDFLEVQDSHSKNWDIVFASASDDHSFRVWSFSSGSQLRVVRCGTGTRVHSILLLEDYIITTTSTAHRFADDVNINVFKGTADKIIVHIHYTCNLNIFLNNSCIT